MKYKKHLNDSERALMDEACDAEAENCGQFFNLVYDSDTAAGAKLLFESDEGRFWVTLRMTSDGTIERNEFTAK